MDFFPHKIPSTTVIQAVTASKAQSVQFINNFNTILVNTASIALNITGSAGTNGSNYEKIGAQGPQGPVGPRGPRGYNAYMISVGYSTGSNSVCYTIPDVGTATGAGDPYSCFYGNAVTYYSDSSQGTITAGSYLYYDSSCSSPVASVSNLALGNIGAFSTNGSGVISILGSCGSSS